MEKRNLNGQRGEGDSGTLITNDNVAGTEDPSASRSGVHWLSGKFTAPVERIQTNEHERPASQTALTWLRFRFRKTERQRRRQYEQLIVIAFSKYKQAHTHTHMSSVLLLIIWGDACSWTLKNGPFAFSADRPCVNCTLKQTNFIQDTHSYPFYVLDGFLGVFAFKLVKAVHENRGQQGQQRMGRVEGVTSSCSVSTNLLPFYFPPSSPRFLPILLVFLTAATWRVFGALMPINYWNSRDHYLRPLLDGSIVQHFKIYLQFKFEINRKI